jgi:hypothetical protein
MKLRHEENASFWFTAIERFTIQAWQFWPDWPEARPGPTDFSGSDQPLRPDFSGRAINWARPDHLSVGPGYNWNQMAPGRAYCHFKPETDRPGPILARY